MKQRDTPDTDDVTDEEYAEAMAALDSLTELLAHDPSKVDVRDAKYFREIIAARHAVEEAEQRLRDAVTAARAAGDSWTIIGAALEVSRQAAQQRFGRSAG